MRMRSVLACGLLLSTAISCTTRHPGSVQTTAGATGASADRVAFLANAVSRSRADLDAALRELHSIAGDTSSSSVARSLQLRRRALSLDSAYRLSLSEMAWTINASTAGVHADGARFPVETTSSPLLRGFVDGTNWMLQSPMIHEIGKNSSRVVIVPRGFVTDLASIPQPLQILRGRNPDNGPYTRAAVVHDYLYWRQDCTRAQADNIMAVAMTEAGVSALERRLVYEAVRHFGQAAWDTNRRAREAGLFRTVAPPHDQVPLTGTWAEYREWIRANGVKEGMEYRVQPAVCTMADSVR